MRRGRGHGFLGATLLAAALLPAAARAAQPSFPLGSLVDTRTGTAEGAADFGTGGGAGSTYPGAVAPFGMVQVSPDTDPSAGNFGGLYTYGDTKLRGFSLTHVSGGGCAGLGDVPILPTTAAVTQAPTKLGSFDLQPAYEPSFSHAGEVARPGDYEVSLGDGTRVELSATTRAGLMRLTFPAGARPSVLVNSNGSAMGDFAANAAVNPAAREITGMVRSGQFCDNQDRYTLYYAVRFDQPFTASGTWQKQLLVPGSTSASDIATGTQAGGVTLQYHRIPGGPDSLPGDPTSSAEAGGYATFAGRVVQARVGISTVSVAGAERNLDAEAPPARSFDALRRRARAGWERRLAAIRVNGGPRVQRQLFDTALYHAQLMPNVISDVDGAYLGMDGQVHRVARGHSMYANVSGWDIYRTQVPLLALIDRPVAADLAGSLVADARQSGGLPKWGLLTGQTNIMVGDSADPIIAGAQAFGATGFDRAAALREMVHGATVPVHSANAGYIERPGLSDWLARGYVGYNQNANVIEHTVDPSLVWGTASTTLEYGLDGFAIARFAAANGDTATCRRFAPSSAAWRNLWDPARRAIRPRNDDGSFASDDAPGSGNGFVEGSESQYTWAVPHDLGGLIAALGGRPAGRARLNALFTRLNGGIASPNAFLGNEPTLHTPYIYDYLGEPGAAGAVIHRALTTLYAPTPGGFPGNDDGGEMSSWWVMSALGLYPVTPGTPVLALTAPLFPHAAIRLPGGTLRIDAPGASAARSAITRVRLNGALHRQAWLTAGQIARGGQLTFRISAHGRGGWASSPSDAPPSFPVGAVCGRLVAGGRAR